MQILYFYFQIILLLNFLCASAADYQLYFQELMTDDFTVQDIVGWTFYSSDYEETDIFANRVPRTQSLIGINQCGNQIGNRIFGGYDYFTADYYAIILEKIYQIKYPHWKLKFNAKLFKIDSWNNNVDEPYFDKLKVYLDTQKVKQYDWNCCDGLIDLCGKPLGNSLSERQYNQAMNDAIELFSYEFNHSASTLQVTFFDSHNSDINETWGLRELQIFIQRCHPSCRTCSGPSEGDCASCFSDSQLLTGKCVCKDSSQVRDLIGLSNCIESNSNQSSCKMCSKNCSLSGYYPDSSVQQCIECNQICKECTSISTKCTSCPDSYFLENDTCKQCSLGCKTCSNNSSCSQCIDGYYLQGTSCVKCPPQFITCTDLSNPLTCAAGFVFNIGICTPCPSGCSICSVQADNSLTCTACFSDYFLLQKQCVLPKQCGLQYFGDPLSGNCVSKCLDGYFPFQLSQKCEKCHPNCSKCFGKEDNNCYECNPQFFFYNFSCESVCPQDTQENRILWQCNPKTTNSETQNYINTYNTQCYIACQMGMWYDESQWTCVPCDSSCLACEIRSATNCTMCKENQYLDKRTKKCVNICTDLHNDQDYRQCEVNCLQGYYLKGNFCYRCQFVGCLDCTEFACTACNTVVNRYFQNGECICQDGYYSDGVRDECFKCQTGCTTCTSASQCQSCDVTNNFILENGKCNCVKGMYFDSATNQCQKCNYSCETCSNINTCDSCASDSKRYLNGLCFCQTSYFEIASEMKQTCTPCRTVCNQCTSLSVCTNCNPNYPHRTLSNSDCVCSSLFYEDNPSDYNCTPYPEGCIQIDLSTKICIKCDKSNGYALVDKKYCSKNCPVGQFYHSVLVECVLDCGDNFFPNTSTNKCQSCIAHCKQCKNDQICDTCEGGYYLLPDTKVCSSECPLNGYVLQYGSCFKCPQNCKTCKSFLTCDVCNPPYVYSSTKGCFCKEGQYFNEKTNVCELCSEFCKECISSTQCSSCLDTTRELVTDATGSVTCHCKSNGYFEDLSLKMCVKCISNCVQCSDASKCQKCNDLSYLSDQKVCECNSLYYKENNECKICTLQGCLECQSSTICSKCKSGYEKNKDNKCEIPKKDDDPGKPKPDDGNGNNNNNNNGNNNPSNQRYCDVTCSDCNGKTKNDCTSCVDSRFLTENNTCLCKLDYDESGKENCSLSSSIDNTLINIQKSVDLSCLSSSLVFLLFSYNANVPLYLVIALQNLSNLMYSLDYNVSKYYEYKSIQQSEVFNIFPLLPQIQIMKSSNQQQGQTFDKLILPIAIIVLLLLFSIVSYLFSQKLQSLYQFYKTKFQYHILLIVYLVTSNYIATQSLQYILISHSLTNYLPDLLISIISLSINSLLMIYLVYSSCKISKVINEGTHDEEQSFLVYLSSNSFFSRYIWIILDLRRYIVIIAVFLTKNTKTVLILNIVLSFIIIIIQIKQDPFLDDEIVNIRQQNSRDISTHQNSSELSKQNFFNSQFGAFKEEFPMKQRKIAKLINQSKQVALFESGLLVYYSLLLANQIINQNMILQISIIFQLILYSFIIILNLLKIIQRIVQLKKGNQDSQSLLKKKRGQYKKQSLQLENFINQINQQGSSNQEPNDLHYSIQVKQNMMFSNQFTKQISGIQNKTTVDKIHFQSNSCSQKQIVNLKQPNQENQKMEKKN